MRLFPAVALVFTTLLAVSCQGAKPAERLSSLASPARPGEAHGLKKNGESRNGSIAVLPGAPPQSLQDVLTQHGNNSRTGATLGETALNVSNVNPRNFGKLFELPVDGQVYAQPLYVSNVDLGLQGVRNLSIVATMHNSVYAFDADSGAQLWTKNFGPPVKTLNYGADYHDIEKEIGIISTPVVDRVTGTVYLVSATEEGADFHTRLRALDLGTGQERANSPVEVTGSVPGHGDGSMNRVLKFDSFHHLQRPALLLTNGLLYVAFGSHNDENPYHGWIFSYDATTFAQAGIFNTSPNSSKSGIWQSGQGPSADENGNVFLATGNGAIGDDNNQGDRPDSILKLRTQNGNIELLDWFKAHDFLYLDALDLDLGVSGTMLLPGTDLVLGGSKTGEIFVLKQSHLGKWSIFESTAHEGLDGSRGHIHGTMVYWQGPVKANIYVMGENDFMKAFTLKGDKFEKTPTMQSLVSAPNHSMPGGILSISANGNQAGSGIVWASLPRSGNAVEHTRPGILRAFNAEDLTQELWNSDMVYSRDNPGNFAKFVPPTIANGRVYLATFSHKVVVYGILPAQVLPAVQSLTTGFTYFQSFTEGRCDRQVPFNSVCQASAKRYCEALGFDGGGYGPVEYDGSSVVVNCLTTQAAQLGSTTFTELQGFHPACEAASPGSPFCKAAANRYCQAHGFHSGFGPVEYSMNQAVVSCLKTGHAQFFQSPFEELQGVHPDCNASQTNEGVCSAAVNRDCEARGFAGGAGILEYLGNVAEFACLK